MARTAMIFGMLLIWVGVGFYAYLLATTAQASVTALIPTFVGLALSLLGWLARNEKYTRHAMHAAAALALLGGIGGAVMAIRGAMKDEPKMLAVTEQALMGIVLLVFVWLCVQSFRAARKQPAGE